MDRTWYCITGTADQEKMDLFWEFNSWVPHKEGRKFTNNTITRAIGSSEVKDYGIWNGSINAKGLFSMRPVINLLGLRIPSPLSISTSWLTFPAGDAIDQVWTYYGDILTKRVFFIWALTPHLAEDVYQAELERLQRENQLNLTETPFTKVQWSDSYKPGDSGEHKIN